MRKIEFIEVEKLKHIEGFSNKRAQWLKKKIIAEKIWTKPLCVERNNCLVLDGQHRMEVAKSMGLKYVPSVLYDYEEVEFWSLRDNWEVSIESVTSKALSGDIYPYKTVKHKFPGEVILCNIPIEKLINYRK